MVFLSRKAPFWFVRQRPPVLPRENRKTHRSGAPLCGWPAQSSVKCRKGGYIPVRLRARTAFSSLGRAAAALGSRPVQRRGSLRTTQAALAIRTPLGSRPWRRETSIRFGRDPAAADAWARLNRRLRIARSVGGSRSGAAGKLDPGAHLDHPDRKPAPKPREDPSSVPITQIGRAVFDYGIPPVLVPTISPRSAARHPSKHGPNSPSSRVTTGPCKHECGASMEPVPLLSNAGRCPHARSGVPGQRVRWW
jgi:hypothetical protein